MFKEDAPWLKNGSRIEYNPETVSYGVLNGGIKDDAGNTVNVGNKGWFVDKLRDYRM